MKCEISPNARPHMGTHPHKTRCCNDAFRNGLLHVALALCIFLACSTAGFAGTHLLTGTTDTSADTSLCAPPVDVPMVTVTTVGDKGGNDATDTTVTVGGTVVAADVAEIRVYYGGVQAGSVTNPGSLTNVNVALPGNEKGGSSWAYHVFLNASAAGKTFNLTVTSIAATDNAVLPFTTATRNANGCANTPPTATINNPANGSNVSGASYTVDGTANDTDGTVTAVDVQIQRQDTSEYWNGSAWQAGAAWLGATGTTSWSYTWNWDNLEGVNVDVTARATDNLSATGTDTNTANVDNQAPRVANGVRFQTLPTSGDANFTLLSDWTEANPGTPRFDYSLNGAGYLGFVNGSAGNASSRTFAVALNGDDRFLAIKSEHTDARGNGPTASEDTAVQYVLPLTPPAPTVGGATTSSLDVTINANAGETGVNMVYAIRENGGLYVQLDGTLGATPVYRTLAGWGTPLTVTGLADNTGYTFSVSAGNPTDPTPTTGERSASAFGTGAGGTTLPIVLNTTTGAVSHSQAGCNVTIDAAFTGDADNDGSVLFEFKVGTNCNGGGYATLTGCGAVNGPSPRSCLHAAAANTDYCYQVTFTDPDGVLGTNPIRYGSINTGACGGGTTTTVGNGTDPANATICPNDNALVDAFTLVTDSGSDTVTSVQVTLAGAADIFNRVAAVEVTSDDGVTVYGTVNNPASNIVNVAVNIPVSTTPVQYKVRVTAEDHANLAAPTHDVSATVTDVTVTQSKSVNDTASATITIDNTAPGDVTWGTVTAGDGTVALNWTNPGGDYAQTVVVRETAGSITFVPTDGTTYSLGQNVGGTQVVRYAGTGTSANDNTVTNTTAYYYKAFTRDACGNWSAGVETGPHTPTSVAVNDLTTGAPSATVNGCDQVTVNAPFSGDDDADSSALFERSTTGGAPWSTICNNVTTGNPRQCVDSTVAASSTYYYRITHSDPDGVNGTNPRTIGPFNTPACAANDTTVSTQSATATTCKQITVTSQHAGDADNDGSILVEYNDGTWKTGCATVSGSSPRQCIIPELAPSASYSVRITYTDPDGVTGTNPTTITPVNTGACGGDQVPPTALVLTPVRDGILGDVDVVKIQVWEDTALAAVSPVRVSVDGNPFADAAVNANYSCGANCNVYEYAIDTTVLTNDSHYFDVRVQDAAGNLTLVSQPFSVYNAGAVAGGDGRLLRRTRGSQLCLDCHDVPTHSSQTTSPKYGSWAIDCLTCHTPHLTENIYLIRETIRTPHSGDRAVSFLAEATGLDFVRGSAPYTGVCNVCHTRTSHHRNDDSGGDHTHNTGASCMSCHAHAGGFAGSGCDGCHNAPPSTGAHGKHVETAAVPSSYTDLASTTTAAQYGFACAKCHQGTHTAQMVAPSDKVVEVAFDSSADPKNPTGAYAADATKFYDDGVAIGDNIRWEWSNGTCSNLYCHSRANPLGGTNATSTPTWNAGAMTCTSCHDTGGAASNLSPTHRLHTDGAGYSFGCVRCHDATVANNTTVDDKTVHVNGVKNVLFDATGPDNSSGSYDDVAHTCANTYCHSNGTDLAAPYTSGPSIAWATTRTCFSCHGSSGDGAPSYANGSPKANSHAKHVPGYACNVCHNNVVDATPSIVDKSLHVNGAYNLQAGGGYSFTPSGSPTTCASNACHGDLTWGQTGTTCRDCHGKTGAGDQDTDDWVYGNGTTAIVDMEDWTAYGHGNTTSYAESGSTGANFDNGGGSDGCLYCHDTGVGHGNAGNPFRLRNVGGAVTATDKNGVCMACHGGGGVDPDGGGGLPSVDSASDIDAYHYGTSHGGANSEGGTFCWDCHDPHGDYNYGIGQRLAYMIDETPTQDHSGSGGWGVPTTTAATPDFRQDKDGSGGWAALDYVVNTSFDGVCQVCHTGTPRFRNNGSWDASHLTDFCTSCHDHDQPPSDAFKPAGGGDCLLCHTGGIGSRRAVDLDFAKRSHHAGSGGTFMGGTLKNEDCVVCHAEGTMSGGATATTDYHNDHNKAATQFCRDLADTQFVACIDLKNVDNVGTVYRYNKYKVNESTGGTVANWSSADPVWRTETSTALDPFCLSCHDSNGALKVGDGTIGEAAATATNPFADLAITNEYDRMVRGDSGDTVGRVVDVASMVVGSPPPDGMYARHAIRGQSGSHNTQYTGNIGAGYSTLYDAGLFVNKSASDAVGPLWNDTSVMGCADCHTTDGANTTAGNAHGSDSEYLLKNELGQAVTGTETTHVCFLCHVEASYDNGHTGGSGSDFVDTAGSDGPALRLAGKGNWTGITCVNCHGGTGGEKPAGTPEGDYKGFGRIHGTSSTFTGYSGGSRPTYRFTNGAGLRYWQTTDWTILGSKQTAAFSCYTLNVANDKWSGCDQHGSTGKDGVRQVARPQSY